MTLDHSVFLSGVELEDGTLLVGAQNGEFDIAATPHSIIKRRTPDGAWSDAGQTRWASACVGTNAAGTGITLLGPYGRWLEFRSDGHDKGDIIDEVDEEAPPPRFAS